MPRWNPIGDSDDSGEEPNEESDEDEEPPADKGRARKRPGANFFYTCIHYRSCAPVHSYESHVHIAIHAPRRHASCIHVGRWSKTRTPAAMKAKKPPAKRQQTPKKKGGFFYLDGCDCTHIQCIHAHTCIHIHTCIHTHTCMHTCMQEWCLLAKLLIHSTPRSMDAHTEGDTHASWPATC